VLTTLSSFSVFSRHGQCPHFERETSNKVAGLGPDRLQGHCPSEHLGAIIFSWFVCVSCVYIQSRMLSCLLNIVIDFSFYRLIVDVHTGRALALYGCNMSNVACNWSKQTLSPGWSTHVMGFFTHMNRK
jgi:hypothetical protein